MHEHHLTGMAQNQPFNNGEGFYSRHRGYSVDCAPLDPQDIGTEFDCGSPRKTRVR
jgi:hypothetical protein